MSEQGDKKRCACGRLLGVQLDSDNYEVRHQGRIMHVSGECTITVTCEICGKSMLVRLERLPVPAV